jgi:putative ABC transport system ATP-binding protein
MILSLMKKMRDEHLTTFVFSTHDPKIVGEADVIYTIEDGILAGMQEKGVERNA